MGKDSKGHGSNKRTWEVKQGAQTYKGLHSSYQRAKEAAHHAGLTRPDTVRMVESKATQAANKKRAIAAYSAMRSTTKNGKY